MKKIFAACFIALGLASAANAMDGLVYSIDSVNNGLPAISGAAEVYLLSGGPGERIAFIIDTVAGEGPSLATVYGVAPVSGDTASFAVAGCSFKMKLAAASLTVSAVEGCSAYMSGNGNYLGFSLSTVSGPTSQQALIDGVASGRNDSFVYKDGGCRLNLASGEGSSVIVSNGDETCRQFMGARATVNGRYEFSQPK